MINPLKKLTSLLNFLSATEERELNNALTYLVQYLEGNHSSESRSKFLAQLSSYLRRKTVDTNLERPSDEIAYLKYVRNSLMHGPVLPDEAVRVAMPMYWRVLRKAAERWEWQRLHNILGYVLGNSGGSEQNTIKKFETRFNQLSESEKFIVFRELLMTTFATPEFQDYMRWQQQRRAEG